MSFRSCIRPLWLTVVLLIWLPGQAAVRVPAARVAEGWTVRHWTVEDGLPVNSINAMTRSRDGYLWLATVDGLVRFDGVRFEVFDGGNSPGLVANRLMVLEQAGDGALWMTSEDMRLMRWKDGAFRGFGAADGLPDSSVISLSVGARDVWAGTDVGVARWTGDGFQRISAPHWAERTTAIAQNDDGTLWLGAQRGRLARRLKNGELKRAQVAGRIWRLLPDADGGAWIAHEQGLAYWPPTGPVREVIHDLPIRRIEFAGSALVLRTDDQLYRFAAGELEHLGSAQNDSGRDPLTLSSGNEFWLNLAGGLALDRETVLRIDRNVTDWQIDAAGGLLVATAGDGLYRLARADVQRLAGPAALNEAAAYPIVRAPDDRLWIGTGGQGLFVVEPGEQQAVQLAANTLTSLVLSVLPEAGDNGWVGGDGLWRLDGGVAHQRGVPAALQVETVHALFRDSSERLWVGTRDDGLWRRDADGWQQLHLPEGQTRAKVRVIAEHRGTVWLGSNGHGLLRWRLPEGFEVVGRSSEAPGARIRALHLDDRGRLWIGTEDRGLCRLNDPTAPLAELVIGCLNRSHGLPIDGIHQVLDDNDGRLWLSSNRGLFSASPNELDAAFEGVLLNPRLLTEADGMANREANGGVQSAGTVDAAGRVWFPTMRGPVMLDPTRLTTRLSAPSAVIEAVHLPGRMLTPRGSSMELPLGARSLSLRFTAPEFFDPGQLRFETRQGRDNVWLSVGTRRVVDFTNLTPGILNVEVRARLGNSAPGPVTALALVIPPRFHETRLFQIVLVVLTIALLLLVWLWREWRQASERKQLEDRVRTRTQELASAKREAEQAHDRVAAQAEQLRQLDNEKRCFFANISHELRTPLTLLLGPLEHDGEADVLVKQLPLMRRNARRLNRLVEQILDLQRIEAGQLEVRPELYDLADWAQGVTALFRSLAERLDIRLRFEASAEGVLAWFDAAQMEKVLGNLLSNAIKYCRPGDAVTVWVERDGERAVLRVDDTGPGIAPEHLPHLFDRFYRAVLPDSTAEGSGIGLALARELMRLHGGDLNVSSEAGRGSCFHLHWPAQACAGTLAGTVSAESDDRDEEAVEVPSRDMAAEFSEADDVMRILVVDDNADLRHWLSGALGRRYRVDQADSGLDALARMKLTLPDVVVTDWMMPEMDGPSLLKAMRDDDTLSGVPAILLTARAGDNDRLHGLQSGAVAFVAKPFRLDQLEAQIDSLIAVRLRLRHAQSGRDDTMPEPVERSESEWLQRLRRTIIEHLHDPEFGVSALADAMAIGRTGLFRQLKDELDASPSELIRDMRLARGKALLDTNAGSVSDIAYAVGFSSLDGFSRAFRRRFGATPSRHRGN